MNHHAPPGQVNGRGVHEFGDERNRPAEVGANGRGLIRCKFSTGEVDHASQCPCAVCTFHCEVYEFGEQLLAKIPSHELQDALEQL